MGRCRRRVGQQILALGERPSEPFMIPLLNQLLGPGDTYLDVGAHWGIYAVVASRLVGPGGRVVAVEPYAPSAQVLLRNAEHNGCRNLTLVQAALSDRAGQGRLLVGEGGDNLNRLADPERDGVAPRSAAPSCPLLTFDGLLRGQALDQVTLCKIDIEGGEVRLAADLEAHAPTLAAVLLEGHPPYARGADVERLYRCLAQGRLLLVADPRQRRWSRIASFAEFLTALPRYYFLSLRQPVAEEARWDAARW